MKTTSDMNSIDQSIDRIFEINGIEQNSMLLVNIFFLIFKKNFLNKGTQGSCAEAQIGGKIH